ncbi:MULTISPECIES: oxidative damage protection protein [Thiomicrospira]|jgi:Fe-S cluster biosynthesis and repair protein YggX|uniref:Probable Fe(2+)-trafficking protein n=2 Tax=Thiomicrospira TaxID=933 RepID=F6DB08_THICA|nr:MULTISPECIES: oxidative damage protection protein [Thiomicrospira]AEG32341.1 Fe(2+)-trafficking protein [Thiomicrospira cyclica ALM1]AHF02055.1 iron transporter [Thiomicrospira aerophila AL3]SFR55935.1 Fe-S cluster biosynthesis and repair protein YggX [Thiomicrospira sp. ALE5]
MARRVQCVKLKQEMDGLDFAPFPGELGQKVFDNVSKEAWKQWLGQQTILINEYRLSSLDPKARSFLQEEMQKFLFSDQEVELPKEFNPV